MRIKILSLFIACFCVASLVACAKQIKYPLIGETYTLTKEGDTVYFNFTDKADFGPGTDWAGLHFSSLQDMYTKITNFQLDKYDLAQIRDTFGKDAYGRIPIADINQLYQPTTPEGFHAHESITWKGDSFNFSYYMGDKEHYRTSFSIYPLYTYERKYASAMKKYEAGTGFDKILSTPDRNATENWSTGKGGIFKTVIYTLSTSNKTIHVVEKYFVEQTSSHNSFLYDAPSETVPYFIEMYGTDHAKHFWVSMYNIPERPTEEWLLSFGLEPFVPEDVA
ncbi:MAG: hypothetical protein J6D31_10335 [Clostridia bacterium]|nr:hypothetical protein [Clostridia bacterium]